MKGNKTFVIIVFLFFSVIAYAQKKYSVNWESIDSRPVPQWFEDAKFGIFIHWGIYSVPAWAPTDTDIPIYAKYSEWYWSRMNDNNKVGEFFRNYHRKMYGEKFQYQDFAAAFKAEHFEPEYWANIFKRSGAKYVVLTSKHHEGFTLWPSEQSWNWNSVDIGPHNDLCGNLSKAVKDAGLYMGFYYSLYEWYNPLYKNNLEKYVDDHMIPQMKDLVTRYKPDILWTDGEWEHSSEKWKSTSFLSWLFNESPVKETICVNDRWGKETRGLHGGFFSTEYDTGRDGVDLASHPWEECRGIGSSFGYNQMETADDYLTSDELIDLLIEKVAEGGNLLLDIGPTADGRIPVIQQQRLLDIGKWLEINGEAIYGTRKWGGSKENRQKNVFFTKKGDDLYLLCTTLPEKKIVVKGINILTNVRLLGFEGKVQTKKSGKAVIIFMPTLNSVTNHKNYAWVFKLENVN